MFKGEGETERQWKTLQTITCLLYFARDSKFPQSVLHVVKKKLEQKGDRLPPLHQVSVDNSDALAFAKKRLVTCLPTLILTYNFKEISRVEGEITSAQLMGALEKLKRYNAQRRLDGSMTGWRWNVATGNVNARYLQDLYKYLVNKEYERLY